MTLTEDNLSALDRRGYVVLDAVTHGGVAPTSTHARPTTFVCTDGKTYWVKNTAQQGLVAELIARRLGATVGASPQVRVVRVPPEALPSGGEADHLRGVVVGIEDVQGAVNARELQPFIGGGQFNANAVDSVSLARGVVFQSWLGVGDAQVLIRLTDGQVSSIDHGDCFGSAGDLADPSVTITAIPGIADDLGKDPLHVREMVNRIETIADREILGAVSAIPVGENWQSPADRRLQIARWLVHRRDRLRGVMDGWLLS